MKPRSEPVEVSSGALIVQEAACRRNPKLNYFNLVHIYRLPDLASLPELNTAKGTSLCLWCFLIGASDGCFLLVPQMVEGN